MYSVMKFYVPKFSGDDSTLWAKSKVCQQSPMFHEKGLNKLCPAVAEVFVCKWVLKLLPGDICL